MRFKFYALILSGICIFVFLLQFLMPGFTEIFLLNDSSWREPWRFLTAIFLHGGVGHLIYNIFALALFGSILEKIIGSNKFLAVFLISGILANVVSVNFYPSSLGASGAIFGIIGAMIIVRPTQLVWAFGLPMPIFIAGILWGVGDLIGAIAFFSGNPISNTGNLAHLSGMFFGIIYGLFLRNWRTNMRKMRVIEINENYIRRWEDDWMR